MATTEILEKIKRIYIIGTMGSGKTTLASKLSKKLKIKHYDLDDVYWTRKFTHKRSHDSRNKKLKQIVNKKQWIIEGVFTVWTEPIFKKSDLVVWLDLDSRHIIRNISKRFLIGKVKGNERGNFKDQWEAIKYAINYRKDSKKFKGHKEMIEKHKPNLVHIKTKKDLRNFLKYIK